MHNFQLEVNSTLFVKFFKLRDNIRTAAKIIIVKQSKCRILSLAGIYSNNLT